MITTKIIIFGIIWLIVGFILGWRICLSIGNFIIKLDIPEDASKEEIEEILRDFFEGHDNGQENE